jgi:hypothetical protein
VLVVIGSALVVATWIGGDPGLALGLLAFYIVAAVIVYQWSGRSGDVAAMLRSGEDERQHSINIEATSVACFAATIAVLAGSIIETARGNGPGAYGVICVVIGVSYIVSLAVLRRRR